MAIVTRRHLITIAAVLALVAPGAQAQWHPNKEMHVVVGLPAGSGGDVIARYYAGKLAELSGQPAIVENKPGMILSLGAEEVAKAAPDGYTILITSITSSHAANLFLFKHLPYDPIRDFTPVTTLQKGYFILMVRPEAPYRTVAELTDAMRKKGDKASYGYGSPPALASAELYKARAGLLALGIAYKTSMASLPEMYRGALDFQFIDSTQGTVQMHSGKLRGLAITAGQRVSGVELPTMAEAANIPEFDIAPAWGVFLPAGAPRPVVERLEAWFNQIVKMPATQQFLDRSAAAAFPGSARTLGEFIPREIEKWRQLIKLAKIEPQ